MSEEVSTFRLYLMRFLYLLNFVGLGLSVWPGLIKHEGAWDPLRAVAISFWAALSALMGLGLRCPLKDVAFASPATALKVDMVNSSCAPAVVRRAINRPHQALCHRGCFGS
jgi:hypothetical protein